MLSSHKFWVSFTTRFVPMRALVCLMMFTACWVSYTVRLQMPILAVPMISPPATNSTMPTHERELFELWSDKPFHWKPSIRGQLISAYSYGNMPGNLAGGVMSMRFGPRATILWTTIACVVITIISPLLANWSWTALLVSRIVIGFFGGVTFPACHTLVAKWAPPTEKARFVWSLMGGTAGTVLVYPMIGYMASCICWEAAWYLPALLIGFWLIFWCLIAYDSPDQHPNISDEEREYITTAQAGSVSKTKPALKDTPILAICTSVPFISLVICHFANMFLLFFYQNSMLLYLSFCQKFELKKGSLLASLPWIARVSFAFFFSWAGDIVKRKELVSLTSFRKIASIFSHFLPGVFLILVGYTKDNVTLINVYLFLSLGFNGAAVISNLTNNQDLSPTYAGFLYGIMNFFGTSSGIIGPIIVEEIAGKHGNTVQQWQTLFWIGAGVVMIGMVIFVIGGSAKIQPWNEPRERGGGEKSEQTVSPLGESHSQKL